jgi:hypothetical protein
LLAVGGVSAPQDECCIDSNVEYNQEGGVLLAVELLVALNGRHIKGQLKIRQGGCTAPIEFGSLSGTRMDLSGKSDRWGKIELAGALRDETVAGVLRWEKAEKSRKRG